MPPLVVSRAKSAKEVGETWLLRLDGMICELEEMWGISVGEALTGGTHAFVAYADGRNKEKYVLKIEMPEELGGEFMSSMAALEMAGGHGYAKLYAYDPARRACLLERLGKPINQLGCSVREQLEIICQALEEAGRIPVLDCGSSGGMESIAWFREFLADMWEKLKHPCSHGIIVQAFRFLRSRERAMNPAEFVLLHGDAHGGNTLRELSGQGVKLIDPEGIIYEKAYDLGVLMREWVEEYEQDPLKKGKERCSFLHRLTGVPEQAIWEWGFLQTVSTAFVLLQIGQEETGRKMLRAAERWSREDTEDLPDREPDSTDELAAFLSAEYGFSVRRIVPAKRGFYGETWKAETADESYFVKIDYCKYHQKSYRNSLLAVRYMTDSGISCIPKVAETKHGCLYSGFKEGVAAVFEYIPGELFEDCPVELLYGHLAEIYRLKTKGVDLETETFGTEPAELFKELRNAPDLPDETKKALDRSEVSVLKYGERLRYFSTACKGNHENFHITHGDAGGNCMQKDSRFFLVDWDSVKLAPIERDAWIFQCDEGQIGKINFVLKESGIGYVLEQDRLCYYCYYFFFYYLDEYLKCIISPESEEERKRVAGELSEYLSKSWIYKRLDAADLIV